MKVKAACQKCNNGWLQELEVEAAAELQSWIDSGRLSGTGVATVERWLVGRLMIWTMREGGLRSLLDRSPSGAPSAIPNFERARHLATNNGEALKDIAIGVARTSGGPLYGFGSATTIPPGKGPFTSVLGLNLPPLQFWVADSLLTAEIRLPRGVRALRPRLPLERLSARGPDVGPDQVVVTLSAILDDDLLERDTDSIVDEA